MGAVSSRSKDGTELEEHKIEKELKGGTDPSPSLSTSLVELLVNSVVRDCTSRYSRRVTSANVTMLTSTTELGNSYQRRSVSSLCVSPTETQYSLFQQQPSPPLLLPPINSDSHFNPGQSRYTWQVPRQDRHNRAENHPVVRTDYNISAGLDLQRSSEVSSSSAPTASYFQSPRGGPDLYSACKREESDLFIPLSRHPCILPGIFDQRATPWSEDHLQSSSFQGYPISSEPASETPTYPYLRPSSSYIPKSTIMATGSFSHQAVVDTSAGTADPAQYNTSSLSSSTTLPDPGTHLSALEAGMIDTNDGTEPVRSRKQRVGKGRERIRIALAPDQPPTTQGKQRERVYVACQQCRSRKIRCDGAKPMCYNCNQRGTGVCEFDPIPKRRGPDRYPGARQRHGRVAGTRRRRSTRNDKEESPPVPQGELPYPAMHDGSQSAIVLSSDRNITTWTRIPSPPSPSSTHCYAAYEREYPVTVPGSSGSDGSHPPQDYRSLLAPSFAFNICQEVCPDSAEKFDDPRLLVSRISTEAVTQSFTSSLSPETPASTSYSALTSPFGTQSETTTSYTSIPPLSTEAINASLENATKPNNSSPADIGLSDFVPRELDVTRPVVVEQESATQIAYPDCDIYAVQQQGSDYSTVPDACTPYSRRESLGSVTSDSYNPYQWAAHQGQIQNACDAYISSSDEDDSVLPYEFTIFQGPSLDFVRKTWWDSLLDAYCSDTYCTPSILARYEIAYGISVSVPRGALVVGTTRQRVMQIIIHDLQTIFRDSTFWFAFFNVPLFFGTLFRARETIQPALIYALLMWSNYLRSSSVDLGVEGMRRTLWLREKAQTALDASVNGSWIDHGLAQAAWLLGLFELSSHPERSVGRLHSALGTLDSIIHTLALTFIDALDPSISDPSDPLYRSSSYVHGTVSHILPMPLYNRKPVAGLCPKFKFSSQLLQYHSPNGNAADHRHGGMAVQLAAGNATCICNDLTLGKVWAEAKEHVPFWLSSPAWNPSWSDADIRREECRRLCWNTLHLFAGYTTYRTSLGLQTLDLFLLHPSNVHNIFPGENLMDLLPPPLSTSKLDTVWALYARAILLWHCCLRIRNVSERERALFAQSVWLEAEAIENALDGHSCGIERGFLYHGREYLFNARMYVSSEFRRFVPHPSPDMSGAVHRRKAEEWLTHQATLAKRIMQGMQNLTGLRGTLLAKRPFLCYWFMGHMSRCLQLWQADKSLTFALELSKNFLLPINYLSALWPCEEQRAAYANMRKQLGMACYEAGLAPPPPVDPTFPIPAHLL